MAESGSKRFDCTICLGPISMHPDKANKRVWDTDVEPHGWCHRSCWDWVHDPVAQLLGGIFGDPTREQRARIAAERVAETGSLTVRRATERTDG